MMEHENTKEARRKLQEYKQKLGTGFLVAFLHRCTRFSYDILLEFLIILHGRTDVLVPCFNDDNWWFTPILITWSFYLLTFYFIVQFGVVLVALTVPYFHRRYWIFFVFFSSSTRSQQGKPRTDAESVGRGNVIFFTEFYLSFLRIKECGGCC